jgi:hypothetical protein
MNRPLSIHDELDAAKWALMRLDLMTAAVAGLGIVFAANGYMFVFLFLLAPAGWMLMSIRPELQTRLAYRKQFLHFAQMTENIAVFSTEKGDDTVVASRDFAVAWLKITGNTNVKVVSGIYEDTRFFVHQVDEKGKIVFQSHERLPADFRCDWQRWEVICQEFKNRIDRQLIEANRQKDNAWVDEYMMRQVTSDQLQNLTK